MQLAPASTATPAVVTKPPISGSFSSASLLPPEFASARIGKGTVRSEIDRAIRVRLEGDGAPSTRTIVPDSKAAAELLASPNGAEFDNGLRAFLAVADPHVGKENLKSITFLPDEHASKGVSVLNWASSLTAAGIEVDAVIEPPPDILDEMRKQAPELSREQVRQEVRRQSAVQGVQILTKDEAKNVSFAGAWNADGHIVMMPDVSRDMLATLGLYRVQPGDDITKLPVDRRAGAARWSWHAALHEAHHSITPSRKVVNPEWTRVMEEAVAEVLTPGHVATTIRAGKGDISLAARPARDTRNEAVDWAAWNRDHLPKPPTDEAATAEGRYTDGPRLVRNLLRLAGLDRRTTEGKAQALDLLQGENSSRVPQRLAEALVSEHELPAERTSKLAELIRKASIGEKSLTDIKAFVGA